jgi:hypothetical protein
MSRWVWLSSTGTASGWGAGGASLAVGILASIVTPLPVMLISESHTESAARIAGSLVFREEWFTSS